MAANKALGALAGGGPAGAAIAALADTFGDLQKSLMSVVGTIGQFVQAISPSTMQAFGQALKDLQATIGSAFTGAMQIVTSAVREIAGALLPTMQRLTPIINTLANAFASWLVAGVRVVASALEALAPILEVVAEAMAEYARVFSDIMGIVSALFRTVANVLGGLLGGEMGTIKDALKSLGDIVRQVVKALVTLVATLAVFAGFRDTVRTFADELGREARNREQRPGGLQAAATNAQIGDILSLAKQQQQAAFIAAGGAGVRERTDTEWLKEIARSVRDTATQQKTLKEALQDWYRENVENSVVGRVFRHIDQIWDKIKRFFGP